MIDNYLKIANQKVIRDENGNIILDSNITNGIMMAIRDGRIPLRMDEKDTMIGWDKEFINSLYYNDKIFTSLDDLVAVHITLVPPVNDEIITKESAGITNDLVFSDPSTNQTHIVPYLIGNDTIHFTLNCPVQNHKVGNDWDSYKYGVLVDFRNLDKSKVLDVKSEDTYLDGNVKLDSNYFLFCPLGEREELSKINPNATIIEYSGITLKDAISIMILISGHKLEPYGTYGWGRDEEFGRDIEDTYKLEKLMVQEGYPVLKGIYGNALHSETKYMARRMWKREYEALLSLIKYNKENNIDMPKEVIDLVLLYGNAYGLPGSIEVTIDDYKEVVLPILAKYGYEVDESLFDGIPFDKEYKIISPSANNEMPEVRFTSWEIEIRNRIIDMLLSKKDIMSA